MALAFNPQGLTAVRTLNGATWNGQISTYFIKPGYAKNIFRGDPVVLNAGFVETAYGANDIVVDNTPVAGVFVGCSYRSPTSVTPIDPASPGRPFYKADTAVDANQIIQAFVINDPNVVYTAQFGNADMKFSGIGQTTTIGAPIVNTQVVGNQQLGTSLGYAKTLHASSHPFRIVGIVPQEGNFPTYEQIMADTALPNCVVELVLRSALVGLS